MTGKVERPTDQKFLSNFYELADFNPNKRLRAAENLLKDAELEKYKVYVLDRLLKGLASGKTAARFGFSAFLTVFVDQVKGFEFDEMKKKIGELLPFTDEKDVENAVGRHFAYTSLENSELFESNLKEITQHHLELLKLAPYLAFSVVDAITSKAKSLEESRFKKLIYPSVKGSLNVELEKISLEGLLFLISFSQIFPDTIKETKSFLNKKVALRPIVYERILELLKLMDVSHKSYFCKELLIFSKKFDRFESVLNEVVLKFVLDGDECKSSERYFILCKELFGVEEFGSSELSTILSTNFLLKCRKYSHRTEPSYRGHHLLISEALEAFKQRTEQGVFSSSDILVMIERIDNVESGDFDTKVGASVRITEVLVSKLDGHDLEGFAKRVSIAESWSYKRLIPAFGGAESSVKKSILKSFLCVHERSIQRFNVGCSLLEQIFKIKKHIHVSAKEEDTQIILDVTDSKAEGIKEKSLLFMAASLKYLGKIAESDEIATEYLNDAREVVLLAKSLKNKTALMDIFFSIVSRVNRIHKILVCYSIGQLGEVLDYECSDFIINTIGKGANELEGDSDDDDDRDFKPITEEERQQVLDKWAKEEEEDETDGSEEEDDEDEEEEIDETLVSDMKKALGKYAFTGESDEDIEMDDAEIEDLDKALGAALKKNSKKGRRESDENLSVFRNKCFDILIVFFTNAKPDVIVKSMTALAELITTFDTPEDEKLLPKIEGVLEAVHGRKKEVADSEVVEEVWKQIIEECVANVRSVKGRRLLGDIFSLLLTFAADHQKLSLPETIRTRVFELVEAKAEEESADVKATLQEILEIILSKYPAYLVDVFPRIAELLVKQTPEKSADLLKLITFACRKDVLKMDEGCHGLKLISTVIPTLEKFYSDLSLLKVNVFSKTVVFLYKFLVSATEKQKEKLKKSGLKKVANSEDFKARAIKLNRDIQQECRCKVSVCIQRLESALN